MSRPATRVAGNDLRFCRGPGGLNDGIETRRIGNSDLAEHFSVQRDIGLLAAVDELTVPHAALPAGCAQSRNPQTPEIPFSIFSVNSSIDARPHRGLFGQTIEPTCGAAMSLYRFENSFLGPMSCGTFSYSWHISFPLRILILQAYCGS
jgi:hypothetical protein